MHIVPHAGAGLASVRLIFETGIATGNATFETDGPTGEHWDAGHRVDRAP